MPVDSVKTTVPGNSGLDFFTFGNVAPGDQVRYAAHLILVYIFTCEFFFFFGSVYDLGVYSYSYNA